MLRWNDPRLSERSLGKSLEECEVSRSEVWKPDLLIVNKLKGEELLEDIVNIDTYGNLIHRQRFRNAVFFSDLDFRNFPLDTQFLQIRFIDIEHEKDEILYVIDKKYAGIREELSVEGWDIKLEEPIITSEHVASVDRFIRLFFSLYIR
jgi:hypothetical protein